MICLPARPRAGSRRGGGGALVRSPLGRRAAARAARRGIAVDSPRISALFGAAWAVRGEIQGDRPAPRAIGGPRACCCFMAVKLSGYLVAFALPPTPGAMNNYRSRNLRVRVGLTRGKTLIQWVLSRGNLRFRSPSVLRAASPASVRDPVYLERTQNASMGEKFKTQY